MKHHIILSAFSVLLIITAYGDPILPNGDFEQADPSNPAKPAHWDLPDGLGVRWTEAPVVPGAPPHGKAIRMDTTVSEKAMVDSYTKAGLTQWVFPDPTGKSISLSYGLSLYSDAVPIVPGKTYRVSYDYLSKEKTLGKLWFRAYGEVNGQMKRMYEGTIDTIWKEAVSGKGNGWYHFTGLFHPARHAPNATEFKIMLYAEYPPGVGWYDNIKVETIDDTPSLVAPIPTPEP